MDQLDNLKTKLENLSTMMEAARLMDGTWAASYEEAFNPVFTLLSKDLDNMAKSVEARIGSQQNWFNPTVGHA
jgi:hypothetical protein